jgi:hypothetical protein
MPDGRERRAARTAVADAVVNFKQLFATWMVQYWYPALTSPGETPASTQPGGRSPAPETLAPAHPGDPCPESAEGAMVRCPSCLLGRNAAIVATRWWHLDRPPAELWVRIVLPGCLAESSAQTESIPSALVRR